MQKVSRPICHRTWPSLEPRLSPCLAASMSAAENMAVPGEEGRVQMLTEMIRLLRRFLQGAGGLHLVVLFYRLLLLVICCDCGKDVAHFRADEHLANLTCAGKKEKEEEKTKKGKREVIRVLSFAAAFPLPLPTCGRRN